MSRRILPLCWPLALWVILAGCINSALGDTMQVRLQPADLGPFPPALGGFLDFAVALEMFDSEGDGVDTQGNAAVVFDIYTDTGLAIPGPSPAPTGESGIYGPAHVRHPRHEGSDTATEALFVGGYGFDTGDIFTGYSNDDDRLGIGAFFPITWVADVNPNAPGLQPRALAGIGYGERPAGGDWLFAEGAIPIPTDPGVYTIDLVPTVGYYILPDMDLTVDHAGGYRGVFDPEAMIGDSFSFTVLPEPGSVFFGAISAALLLRQRRPRS